MTRTCNTCQQPFDYEPIKMGEIEVYVPFHCDPCIEQMQAKREGRDPVSQARLTEGRVLAWKAICPPLYQETDLNHPNISQKAWTALQAWTPDSRRFLGLWAKTGVGKTRLSFARLEALHMAGWDVFAVSAKKLQHAVQRQFRDDDQGEQARTVWRRSRNSGILLLDDMGKEKYSETVASEFYDLIEHRTSHLLPMIWTANLGPKDLESRLGEEYGSATLRRLLEFSDIVTT